MPWLISQVRINTHASPSFQKSSSFVPDVVCSVFVIPLQHRSCSVFMSTGRLLGRKVGNSIKLFSKDTAMRYTRIGSQIKVSQPFDYWSGGLPTEPRRSRKIIIDSPKKLKRWVHTVDVNCMGMYITYLCLYKTYICTG